MKEENNRDTELIVDSRTEITSFSIKKRNRFIAIIVLLIVLNTSIFLLFPPEGVTARHFDGSLATNQEVLRSMILYSIIGVPVTGYILGLLVAFLPYQNLEYSKKYLRASLLSMIAIELFMSMSRLSILLRS